jgi:hypothetical protein
MFANGDYAARMAATNTIVIICYLLTLPIVIGFMSLTYVHFFQRDHVIE